MSVSWEEITIFLQTLIFYAAYIMLCRDFNWNILSAIAYNLVPVKQLCIWSLLNWGVKLLCWRIWLCILKENTSFDNYVSLFFSSFVKFTMSNPSAWMSTTTWSECYLVWNITFINFAFLLVFSVVDFKVFFSYFFNILCQTVLSV